MGMFDEVSVSCPNCGSQILFQTKAGECVLSTYSLDNAPEEILDDVVNKVENCDECQYSIVLREVVPPRISVHAEIL